MMRTVQGKLTEPVITTDLGRKAQQLMKTVRILYANKSNDNVNFRISELNNHFQFFKFPNFQISAHSLYLSCALSQRSGTSLLLACK